MKGVLSPISQWLDKYGFGKRGEWISWWGMGDKRDEYYEKWVWFALPSPDSDEPIDRANYIAICASFAKLNEKRRFEPEIVQLHSRSKIDSIRRYEDDGINFEFHYIGGNGGAEAIFIKPLNGHGKPTQAALLWELICQKMDDYPLLDEFLYSEISAEMESEKFSDEFDYLMDKHGFTQKANDVWLDNNHVEFSYRALYNKVDESANSDYFILESSAGYDELADIFNETLLSMGIASYLNE